MVSGKIRATIEKERDLQYYFLMRIATLSLNINAPDFNYGAILHSWAFARYLRTLPYVNEITILDYTMPKLEGQDLRNPILDCIKRFNFPRAFRLIKHYHEHLIKYSRFQQFIKSEMPVSAKSYTQKSLAAEHLDYDALVVESDVVWAPGFTRYKKELFDKSFFLAFDNMRKIKRIAYAPSMANAEFSADEKDCLKELLTNFDGISCREGYEKRVLEELTGGGTIMQVLDPVLLLEATDYSGLIDSPIMKDRYLLLYLPVDNNDLLRSEAVRFAQANSLKILEISTEYKMNSIGQTLLSAGPREFLSAIYHAEMIFTNSFHAICFSLIFQKQFYAFSRRYDGKVRDICKQFNLENRFIENGVFADQPPIDYGKVNKTVCEKREMSKSWLESQLLSS